jgi:hypothetical protein
MEELSQTELAELIVGTWIGIASIVEVLIEKKLISRADINQLLTASGAMTEYPRRQAISGIRDYIGCARARDAVGRLPVPVVPEERWPDPDAKPIQKESGPSYTDNLCEMYRLMETLVQARDVKDYAPTS